MSELTKVNSIDLVDPQAQRVVEFLQQIGLPFENIIADQSARNIIGKNLPTYIESLPPEIKRDARYLSKFVVGAGFGLFDYSLNAIWNEVVIDLRKKAIAYGIDIFFDSAALSDRDAEFGRADTVKEKGFYILPSELFANVVKNAKNNANLNETLAAIFRDIENSAKGTESEDDLKGLFDEIVADFEGQNEKA